MKKNKSLTIGLAVIAVCMMAIFAGLLMNRSTSREATPEELAEYQPYEIGWTPEQILGECMFLEEAEIGKNSYQIYDSTKMQEILYHCSQIERIAQDASGILYVQYTDSDDRSVTLAYTDEGLMELAVYDSRTDTLFHKTKDQTVVWEKFRSGVQWGGK